MNDLDQKIFALCNGLNDANQIVAALGCSRSAVYRCAERYGANLRTRKKPVTREDSLRSKILAIADGKKTSSEIALILGCSEKYVQNTTRISNAPRLPRGAMTGEKNHGWIGGRTIDLDGYACVLAPEDHPFARKDGSILEHRLEMEKVIGRYLKESEVVDHIDGLHLHNAPSNLRLFATNADHLRATISGNRPNWSDEGWEKMNTARSLRANHQRVDKYRQSKKRGDVRLLQILRALSQFGIDSPFLLGTLPHLRKAQIDPLDHSTIERELARLSR